jgi:flagellum-specific peptidoglycan hydrolase FlgJ
MTSEKFQQSDNLQNNPATQLNAQEVQDNKEQGLEEKKHLDHDIEICKADTHNQCDMLREISHPKDLNTHQLLELRQKNPESLKTHFTKEQPDGSYKIDFLKNAEAEFRIGAGHLLGSDIQVATINGAFGVRQIRDGRIGYYDDNGRYLAIHTGDNLKPIKGKEADKKKERILGAQRLNLGDKNAFTLSSKKNDTEHLDKKIAFLKEQEEKMQALREKYGLTKSPDTRQDFINLATAMAKDLEKNSKYKIPWQVMVAQATLESGFGQRVKNNAYFGIKPGPKYQGKTQKFLTTEFFGGEKKKIVDSFRAYDSMYDAFEDYAKFLSTDKHYRDLIKRYNELTENNPQKKPMILLQQIITAGYATDPEYVAKAEVHMKKYNIV